MSTQGYEYPAEDLRKLSSFAAIALATAAIEKVLGAASPYPEVDSLLRRLLDELWAWQRSEKPQGRADMTVKEAKALPSAKLYRDYEARLLELTDKYRDQDKVYNLVGATFAALAFIMWHMDGLERAMNSGKPFVLGNDIMEVDWETLADALRTTLKASDAPGEVFKWHKAAIARLGKDYPDTADRTLAWRPVSRDFFTGDLSLPARAPGGEPPVEAPEPPTPAGKYEAEELAERFSDYAAIAFATAALERVLGAAAAVPELHASLRQLIDELWKWPSSDKPRGKVDMSEEEARSLVSFKLFSRVAELRGLLGRYQNQPKVQALISAVADALVFVSWLVNGIEDSLNPGTPFVIGDESDERQWGALADALDHAARAAEEPERERQWQARTIQRLTREHPGDPEGGHLGEPLSRDYFR